MAFVTSKLGFGERILTSRLKSAGQRRLRRRVKVLNYLPSAENSLISSDIHDICRRARSPWPQDGADQIARTGGLRGHAQGLLSGRRSPRSSDRICPPRRDDGI